MKKSVQIIKVKGNYLQSRTMGEIKRDIAKILIDNFGVDQARGLCDDLGSILCDKTELSDKEWKEDMTKED